MANIDEIFKGKTVVVTGGLGSIGGEMVRQLLKLNPAQIRVLDNRETELFYARERYSHEKNIRFLYGDVRDLDRLVRATKDADIIFHAAALKHVMLCEYDPFEAVKTNVLGTQNVIEAALTNEVGKVILISTDKAISPSNVMGATKLLAERLIGSTYFTKGPSKTRFGAVRFGNVLGSRGSVLEIWDKQLGNREKITVTDPKMTRFFMSIPQSVNLIFQAAALVDSGETFILKMPSVRIADLASVYLELKGKPSNHLSVIGKRPGEKLHEVLFFDEEIDYVLENGSFFVRLPLVSKSDRPYKAFTQRGFRQPTTDSYSSADEPGLLSKDEIKDLLKEIL